MLLVNEFIYDVMVNKFCGISKVLFNLFIDIVDEFGILDQMDVIIFEYREMYLDEQIMVFIDYVLFVLVFVGDNEIEMMVCLLWYMWWWVKDYKVILFLLFQGNSEIENDYCISFNNFVGYIFKKWDVFGFKQVFYVFDMMIFLYQFVLLGIIEYGFEQIFMCYQGDNVLVVMVMKNRFGLQNV